MQKQKLTNRIWFSLIIFGLFGQIAWVVENMYFNVFMYKTVTYNLTATAIMVAASAVVATVFTILAGNLSDRLGKRKLFISWGYILWGFSLMAFAAISVESTQKLFPTGNAVVLTVAIIVLMDCIMTAIGSTANDAAFNAWVTDITSTKNRGKAESVVSIMSVMALLVVFGAFDSLTQKGMWKEFFFILGGITTFGGVLGMFLIKDSNQITPKNSKYLNDVVYGFKWSTIKENKYLYIVYLAMAIVGIANNTYMPYLIVYIEYFLGIGNYAIFIGIIIVVASVASVLIGSISDKYDRRKFIIPIIVINIIGAIGLFFAKEIILLIVAGSFLMTGNIALVIMLSASARDLTPADKTGMFQGIRMVFYVLLPMCIGPFIGSYISKTSNAAYIDPVTNLSQPIPSNYMFLGAVVVLLFIFIPISSLLKMKRSNLNINDASKKLVKENN